MQAVVTSLLKLSAVPKPDDAADALAIALCHAQASRFGELFAVGNMTRTKGKNTVGDATAQLLAENERRIAARKAQAQKRAQEKAKLETEKRE